MIRQRGSRVALSSAVTLMLVMSMFAGPAGAKNPDANLSGDATAAPAIATAGAEIRIDVFFTNTSSSNFATFDVASQPTNPGPITEAHDPQVEGANGVIDSTTPHCTVDSGNVSCSFGALNAGATASFWVIADVPADARVGSTLTWYFDATSTGSTPNDNPPGHGQGQSHGDVFTVSADLTIGDRDSGGTYIHGTYPTAPSVEDSSNLNKQNGQHSAVHFVGTSFGDGFPASVQEVDGAFYQCLTSGNVLLPCFEQWSVISVNYGEPVPDGFTVTIGYDKIVGNQAAVSFIHLLDPDGDGIYNEGTVEGYDYELIPAYKDDPCSSTKLTGCIQTIWTTQGDYFFTLILNQNGPLRGF